MHPEYKNFTKFETARFLTTIAVQMQTVALGWQMYSMTHRPLDLGLMGLMQFLPIFFFSLFSGQVADRFNRKYVVVFCYALMAFCMALFCFLTFTNLISRTWVLGLMILMGFARGFAGPSMQSIFPSLVTGERFQRAIALHSSIWQVGTIAGPALGGLIYGWSNQAFVVYAISLSLTAVAMLVMSWVEAPFEKGKNSTASQESIFAGIQYIRSNRIILGAISLDLFAVLLGGAVALLPVFASDILKVGPTGLGFLRSAPGIGAALTGLVLSSKPVQRNSGMKMFLCVLGFGIATICFGLSKSFYLSLACLLALGAFDLVSVVIRHSLVQLRTPPEMRGRVSAVNMVFISASNELGEFESGITAAWFGVIPAVVIGGIGTCLVTILWAISFPDLRKLDHLVQK